MSKFYTALEIAEKLKIKKTTVYELIKRGDLQSSKVGKQLRISEEQLDEYLNRTLPSPFQRSDPQRADNPCLGTASFPYGSPSSGNAGSSVSPEFLQWTIFPVFWKGSCSCCKYETRRSFLPCSRSPAGLCMPVPFSDRFLCSSG